jgi:hypothetical protein
MKKIKITESDLYNIIKQVLLEQEEEEEEENVWYTDAEDFKFRLFKAFDGDSEKFAKYHNKYYDKIVVDGDKIDMNFSYSDILKLPDNLKVNGHLMLSDNPIKDLPKNLHVSGNLFIRDTLIGTLPNNLIVNGNILIHGTPLYVKVWDDLELGELFSEAGFKLRT